jgi:hypothetical protein
MHLRYIIEHIKYTQKKQEISVVINLIVQNKLLRVVDGMLTPTKYNH